MAKRNGMNRFRSFLSIAVLLMGWCCAFAQEQWVIEFNNGSIVHYNIDDIRQMYISPYFSEPEADTVASDLPVSIEQAMTASVWNPEYVDLGLSVKWATCNVGAQKPEELGFRLAWGETKPKTRADWSLYKFSKFKKSDTNKSCDVFMTKYCCDSIRGTNIDGKTTLDPEDDAAHVVWGGNWRMPTSYEFQELIDSCSWIFTTQNGVNGYKVQSNIEGYTDNSIFIPVTNDFDSGFYWTSSLFAGNSKYEDDSWYAWHLNFNPKEIKVLALIRRNLQPVRPVCE